MRERRTAVASFVLKGSEQRPPELALGESLGKKNLTPAERRMIQAIDVLRIPLKDKEDLFEAHLFSGSSGVLRAAKLGFSVEKIVGARNRVVGNDRYEELWEKVKFLMLPSIVEIAVRKKEGITSNRKIAESLSMSVEEVNEISKVLVLARLVEPSPRGRRNAEKARILHYAIMKIRDETPSVPNSEIARRLTVSLSIVEKVIGRAGKYGAILHGKSQKGRSPEEIQSRRRRVKVLWTSTKLTQEQIADELTVSQGEVRYDLKVLRRKGEVLAQKPGSRRRTINQSTIFEAKPT